MKIKEIEWNRYKNKRKANNLVAGYEWVMKNYEEKYYCVSCPILVLDIQVG